MRCKVKESTLFRGKNEYKKRNRNGHVCIHYGICYGCGGRTRLPRLRLIRSCRRQDRRQARLHWILAFRWVLVLPQNKRKTPSQQLGVLSLVAEAGLEPTTSGLWVNALNPFLRLLHHKLSYYTYKIDFYINFDALKSLLVDRVGVGVGVRIKRRYSTGKPMKQR